MAHKEPKVIVTPSTHSLPETRIRTAPVRNDGPRTGSRPRDPTRPPTATDPKDPSLATTNPLPSGYNLWPPVTKHSTVTISTLS